MNNLSHIDLSKMYIFVDGKTVYKSNKLKIDRDVNANWLLKKLFKIVYIWVNGCGESIMIFPKYGRLSCIMWNLSGGKYTIDNNLNSIMGKFKITDIKRKSFRLIKIIESEE